MKKTILTCFVLLNLATLSQTMTQEIEQDVMEAFKIHAFPGDSLSGFPEKAIREDLATKNVVGQELENHIKQLKRDYIKNKYYRKDEKAN
jgi:hypothetical protein